MRSLPLSTRAFLLVAFPLACQFILVCFLATTLWTMQTDLSKQFRSKALISDAYATAADVTQAATLRASSGRFLDASIVSSMAVRATGKLSRLTQALEAEPDHAGQAQRLNSAANNVFTYADACWRARELGLPTSWAQEGKAIDDLHQVVSEIIEVEKRKQKPASTWTAAANERIQWILILAVGASALLALGLGALFAATIRQPLSAIKENSKLLAQCKPLPAPLLGTDELSRLDRVLHNVAKNVNEAVDREKSMVDYAADLVCTLDEHGQFTAANPFAARMLGYEPAELVGRYLSDIVAAEDQAAAQQHLRTSVASGLLQTIELRLCKNDGVVIDTKWSSLWSTVERSLFCVVHDISEQKRIEDLKQDFVNMVTHDLRSPLTSLFGSLKLISAGAKGPVSPAVETEVNVAANNVSKLVVFVNDLLDFQKLRVGKMQLNPSVCDLEEIFSESIAFVTSMADAKRVTVQAPDGHWSLRCDKPKMLQTLTNLISNAIKFAPEDSVVEITVQDSHSAIQVCVGDSGPGVPEQYRERIFEAFEQVPAMAGGKHGTGLGLAICKLVVEAHGGTIGLTSKTVSEVGPGGTTGSTFWLKIPR